MANSSTFTTRHDAIGYVAQVIENGDATADEFDVDAIVDTCFDFDVDAQAFVLTVDTEAFWEAVADAHI